MDHLSYKREKTIYTKLEHGTKTAIPELCLLEYSAQFSGHYYIGHHVLLTLFQLHARMVSSSSYGFDRKHGILSVAWVAQLFL